jgi:plastocyanin
MNDHHPLPDRTVGGRSVWMGSALLGLVVLAVSASAQTPRFARPAATPSRAVMAQATGAGKTEIAAKAVAHVEITNYEFRPAVLTVPTGTMVTWTSHDDDPHTVTSSENVFASPGLDADETFSYSFSTPGTYPYSCRLHPQMTGTIIVK